MGGVTERAARILDRAMRTQYHVEDGKEVVSTYQDVQGHLDYAAKCRRAEAEGRGDFGKRPFMHRTMAVPMNVLLGIVQKLRLPPSAIFDPEVSKRVWNEVKGSDYKNFRVTNDKRLKR